MSFPSREMQPSNTTEFNGNIGSNASSSSGISLGQQANINLNMNNMGIAEGCGHEIHHQPDESDRNLPWVVENGFNTKISSENPNVGSGDNHSSEPSQSSGSKRKKYHRHTQLQIQELENFFKQCQHPDDNERKELSNKLGLDPQQVKFWFQNRRTQMKNQNERVESQQLRSEIEKLEAENFYLRQALASASCRACGGPIVAPETSRVEEDLRTKNDRLTQELTRVSRIASRYVGRPFKRYENGTSTPVPHLLNPANVNYGRMFPMAGEVDLFTMITRPNQVEKCLIVELVVNGTEELMKMAQTDEPLWTPSIDGTTLQLCYQEYNMMISGRQIGQESHGFKWEASRCKAIVAMSSAVIVEMLMNLNQWSAAFSSIVTRATDLEVLATSSSGKYNGTLHLVVAEFQLPSPIVPTRSNYFARYCKQHSNRIWTIVDVPLEGLCPDLVIRLHRRPSGCLIEELPNGDSKVTWVEHIEVDDLLVHQIYKPVVNNGLAFGAERWLATLDRQCDRLASASVSILSSDMANWGISNQEGMRNMMKLAERIVRRFHQGVSSNFSHPWKLLSGTGADDVRILNTRFADEPGRPNGVVLCASISFWVPASPKSVFDFLCKVSTRHEWDILCDDPAEQIAHIGTGQQAENFISLYRIPGNDNMIILQETSVDASGFFVIYAPLDIRSINTVLNGTDSAVVPIMPSGVAILPDGNGGNGGIGGSLVTLELQFLADPDPNAEISLSSIASVQGMVTCTVDRIKSHMMDIYNAFLQLGNDTHLSLASNNAIPDG